MSISDSQDVSLKKRRSFSGPSHKEFVYSGTHCKSDANLILSDESSNQEHFIIKDGEITSEASGCGEYYKDADAMPVKEDSISCDITSTESGNGERVPLTESHLVKLEQSVFSNISHEIPASGSSASLPSKAKDIKNTVEEIFEKFYANMVDFEQYKMRYHTILSRKQDSGEEIEEMEDFVKGMIHHIISSESSDFNGSRLCTVAEKGTSVSTDNTDCPLLRNLHSVVEAFKNDSYLTDSTADEKGCRSKPASRSRKDDILSICLMSGSPCDVKMNNRKLLSEINVSKSHGSIEMSAQAASAEDIKKLAAKKLALERFERQQNETYTTRHFSDREIPVKMSFAKKNIHLDEDFESSQNEKSLISRICNYLCKRLRKTSLI